MNIAVVDDEEAIREQIGGFIKKRNPDFNISDFATGEELAVAVTSFDIIFLDIQMDGMGGIEAARTLYDRYPSLMVIMPVILREEYVRLNEESALKRRLMEQETDERYYQTSITKKAVSIAAYEAAGILK